MKEYYTNVITHDSLEASDLSRDQFIRSQRQESLARSKSPNRESPIRMNDTYRSNIVFGDDNNEGADTRYQNITNTIIDQQEWHKSQYQRAVKGDNANEDRLYQSARSRSNRPMTSTPTNRQITSDEQSQITLSNRSTYQDIKTRCGQIGQGAKLVLNHEEEHQVEDSSKLRNEKSAKRNLNS